MCRELGKDRWEQGRVVRLKSEKFGTHDFLCVRGNYDNQEERQLWLRLNSSTLLFFSSCAYDEEKRAWVDLQTYFELKK